MKFQKAAAAFAAVIFLSSSVLAGEIDRLASILAEKGIISYGEAQQLITETNEEIRQKTASGANSSIPAWVQNIKFSGDIRLRHQADWNGANNRDRERLRLRFGFEARPVENLTAAFGLASSAVGANGVDANPTSTNATFDGFNKLPIFIDFAYLQYGINNVGKVNLGKVKPNMALWNMKQLVWDTDINPDGITLNVDRKLGNGFDFFGNAGYLFIRGDTTRPNDKPDVYIFQPGVNYKTGNISVKAALSYQQFNTKDRTVGNFGSNATGEYLPAATVGSTDYRLINPAVEVGVNEVAGRYGVKVFGEYVKNISVDDSVANKSRDEGGLYGITFGDNSVRKFGDWNITYAGRYLMDYAVPYGLSFSDAYSGRTGIRGYEVGLNFGLTKNATFTFAYLNYDRIHAAGPNRSLTQADISYKF